MWIIALSAFYLLYFFNYECYLFSQENSKQFSETKESADNQPVSSNVHKRRMQTLKKYTENDEDLIDSLFLVDNDYYEKRLENYSSLDPAILNKYFRMLTDYQMRIYLLKNLANRSLWTDTNVLDLFIYSLQENVDTYDQVPSWKLRGAAAYLISQHAGEITGYEKQALTGQLLYQMEYDKDEHVKGLSVLALAKLYQAEDNGENSNFTKARVLHYINNNIESVNSNNDEYFVVKLIQAAAILKSPTSLFFLLQKRYVGFSQFIEMELDKAVKSITGSESKS